MSVEQFQSSTWKVISQDTFQSLWQQEVNQSPEFEVDSFYLITGLLLPIWNRLDRQSLRVFIPVNDKATGIIEKIRQLA
jgi:hypothetical protein